MMLRREPARDDDELIRYLLGELTDDQAESLDERSVVDDDFVARLRLIEEDLVDAYATGRLAGDRRTRFESFYLSSPRRLKRAVFAQRFLAAVDNAARDSPAPAGHGRAARWLPLTIAAAVVLSIGSGWMLVRDARLRTDLHETQQRLADADRQTARLFGELAQRTATAAPAPAQTAAPSVALVLLPQTRGSSVPPILAVGVESSTVTIELAVAALDRSPYQATLRDPATNSVLWRSDDLTARRAEPAPLVTVTVPAASLKAQHYSLELFTRRNGRTGDFVGGYPFQVLRP